MHTLKLIYSWLLAVALVVTGTLNSSGQKITLYQTMVAADFSSNNAQIDPIPFDKAFSFNIKVDTGIKKAELVIALAHPDQKKALNLPVFSGGTLACSVISGNIKASCNGLQPNRPYTFHLKLYSGIPDKIITQVKKKVISSIEKFINTGLAAGVKQADLEDELATDIEALIGAGKLTDPTALSSVSVKTAIHTGLDQELTDLFVALKDADNFTQKKKNLVSHITAELSKPEFTTLLQKLSTANGMVANSATLYKADLNIDSTRFKGINMGLLALYLHQLQDPSAINDLFSGHQTFYQGAFTYSDQMDIGFIRLLDLFFNKVKLLRWNSPPSQLTAAELQLCTNMASYLYVFDADFKNYLTARQNSDPKALVKSFPDLLAGYLLKNELIFDKESTVDITADNSPYISLDAGIGYNRAFQTCFSSYGVNFYFTPVDKSVPLRTYAPNPWLYMLKTVSVNVSILNNYFNSSRISDRHSALLGGNKDLFLGLGYRFSRIAKFNLGADCYFLNQENPISTEKDFHAKLVFSLSLDVNFIKGFSNVGTALGLLN